MLARSPLLRIRVRIPCVCEHHGDVGKEQDPVCDEIHYAPSAITTLPDHVKDLRFDHVRQGDPSKDPKSIEAMREQVFGILAPGPFRRCLEI